MKKLFITFHTTAACMMEVEVSDDYKLSSNHPHKILKDLYEKYPDEIETDILTDDFKGLYGFEIDGFMIEQMGLDYIESVQIEDSDGNPIEVKFFKRIPINNLK